jgi:hypothetical protein
MIDIAAIIQHDHHAESVFAVRPTVLFTCFTLLHEAPYIKSLIAEALFLGKSGQTVKAPVLQHTINKTFYVSICLDSLHMGFLGRGGWA